MYCPQCGQQQLSDNLRFCSRCGFPLEVVLQILGTGGMLPALRIRPFRAFAATQRC